jgi:phosphosulfolactate synthase (CoM biosynthesis protein A)
MADQPADNFDFLQFNRRPPKPRTVGLTEIRGPYYTPTGRHYLQDLLEAMGDSIDTFKFGGGSFVVTAPPALKALIDLCHRHDVRVSTGGFIEYVMTQGPDAVDAYVRRCKDLGFDTIEISAGFVTIPLDDWLRLVEKVKAAGLKAKAEVGIQYGAGGATSVGALEREGTQDTGWMIHRARRLLEAGADQLMIESEGITENVRTWRSDVPSCIAAEIGLEKVMFEAADPAVFTWYVKTFGPEVNLFVDHSQVVQLACLRAGIWGTSDVWGRVRTLGR